MAGFISGGMSTALGQGITPQQYHQQQRLPYAAANTGVRAGWANQQLMDQMAARANPGSGTWRPSYLNTPMSSYPAPEYAVAGGRYSGGGGRGGFAGTYNAYEPSMFLGPGAYWPGHQAEFQGQQQVANMLIMQGRLAPDNRQPSQMAASMMAGRNSPNPFSRMAAGGSYSNRGVGGSSYGGPGGLAGAYQDAMNRANQANEARYRDMLEGSQALHDRSMGYLQNMGEQEAADIDEGYDSIVASRRQALITRGLMGGRTDIGGLGFSDSSRYDTMRLGTEREKRNDLGRLNERLRNQYLATDIDTTRGTLGIMERRTDQQPDYSQLAALAQLQGQAGGVRSPGTPQAYQVSMGVPGYEPILAPISYYNTRDAGMANAAAGMGMNRQQIGRQNVADKVAFLNKLKAAGFSDHAARLEFSRNRGAYNI